MRSAGSYRYPELLEHLETSYRRVHQDEHLAVYDLADRGTDGVQLDPSPAARVLVIGTLRRAAHRPAAGPLSASSAASGPLAVEQHWRTDDQHEPADIDDAAMADADYVVYVRDDVDPAVRASSSR